VSLAAAAVAKAAAAELVAEAADIYSRINKPTFFMVSKYR
jgi:hypothetical protein